MNHLLPHTPTLLKNDFQFIKSDTVVNFELTNPAQLMIKKLDNEYFYTFFDTSSDPTLLHWQKTILVEQNILWPELIELFSTYDILLCQQDEEVMGYLSRKEALSALYQSYQHLHAYFNTVLNTADVALTLVDMEERVAVWTEGAENMFSIPQEDIIGKPATDFFADEMLQSLKTLRTGESVKKRQHTPRENMFVLVSSNPVMLDDEIVGAVTAEIDITTQIRLHQELIHMSNKVHHLQNKVKKLSPSENPFVKIIGTSQYIKNCIEMIKKISKTKASVLITGESGVGKELFAKAIHDSSEEKSAPFIAINCGAIPPSLFESELFGYEGGAFSGANPKGKKGKFELAEGGTLFLDEIGEMPLEMQVKLLRVLQERSYFRVGGIKTLEANCRIITATNRNLEEMIRDGKFREDLYYRLNVVTLDIPPLRNRKEDIYELVQGFLHEFSISYNTHIQHFPHDVFQALLEYDWPGNIRELRNTIERLVIFSVEGQIKLEHLPSSILNQLDIHTSQYPKETTTTFQEKLEEYEKNLILDELKEMKGNKNALAKKLGISRATLYYKLKKFGI